MKPLTRLGAASGLALLAAGAGMTRGGIDDPEATGTALLCAFAWGPLLVLTAGLNGVAALRQPGRLRAVPILLALIAGGLLIASIGEAAGGG